jgi:hypothetical protein
MSLVHLVVFANVPSVDHEDDRKQKDKKSEATKHDLKRLIALVFVRIHRKLFVRFGLPNLLHHNCGAEGLRRY